LEMLPMVMPTIPTILGIFGAEAPPLVAALEPTLQAAADINALKALYDAERPFVAFGKIDVRYGPMWKRAEEWPAQVRHTLPAPFGVNRIYGPSAQGPEGRICHSLRMFHRVRRTVRGAGRMCLVHILLALSVHLFNPYQPKLILTRPAWRVFAMQLLGIQLLLNAGADASRSPSLLSALAAAEVHPGGGFHAGAGWVWAGLHGRHALRFPQQVDAAPYHHTPGSVLVQRQFHTARTQVAQAMEANIALARKRFDYVHFDAAASDKLDQRVEKWEKQCDVTVRKLHQLEQMVLLTHQFRARRQCLADHYARRAQVPPLSPASTTTLTTLHISSLIYVCLGRRRRWRRWSGGGRRRAVWRRRRCETSASCSGGSCCSSAPVSGSNAGATRRWRRRHARWRWRPRRTRRARGTTITRSGRPIGSTGERRSGYGVMRLPGRVKPKPS
jgi:hypothetical protein